MIDGRSIHTAEITVYCNLSDILSRCNSSSNSIQNYSHVHVVHGYMCIERAGLGLGQERPRRLPILRSGFSRIDV